MDNFHGVGQHNVTFGAISTKEPPAARLHNGSVVGCAGILSASLPARPVDHVGGEALYGTLALRGPEGPLKGPWAVGAGAI